MQVYTCHALNRIGTVAFVVWTVCLLSACAPLRYPPLGESVSITQGESLVVGQIRIASAGNKEVPYSTSWPDPWDEPFFRPDMRMTIELRWLTPKNIAFNYRSYPAPHVEKDGFFYWILKPGDYLLLGNPHSFGSKQFSLAETQALARFRVPSTGGTIYLGCLVISIEYNLEDLVGSWITGEAKYEIRDLSVVDEREQGVEKLQTLFSAIPNPMVVELMSPEWQ